MKMNSAVTATRLQGLAMLQEFVPSMGFAYAAGRNFDRGPGQHRSVSGLSPWIRRRLVTEAEVVAAAVAAHGPDAAEKFVQEVVWRGYFRGWLERRPQVWISYRDGLAADLGALARDRQLRADVQTAMSGQTGLACFDAWVDELLATGYLHNHARMWFASIWIFTLRLPWRLGADFFLRHLLDGDVASNTLGWRWVAGLHTRGKAYHAQAWNIATFTGNRHSPEAGDLAAPAGGLEATEPEGLPPVQPLRAVTVPEAGRPTALLLTDEDCRIDEFDLSGLDIRAVASLTTTPLRSPLPVAAAVSAFEAAALADTAERLGRVPVQLSPDQPDALIDWAVQVGATQIVTPYRPRGPLLDWFDPLAPRLGAQGITLAEWRRDWDSAIWPHATAGFFKVKEKIPAILAALDR